MEPSDGSTLNTNPSTLQAFQQHRGGKFGSHLETPDASYLSSIDSGYLTTSNNTPNILSSSSGISLTSSALVSSSSEILTPERISGTNISTNNNSNLNPISEFNHHSTPDPIKLTPVTQNIQSICNFHITTPKDVQGTKRNLATVLNCLNHENTPKKPRLDNYYVENVQREIFSNTTPRKTTKYRSKKQSFRKKLKSAPDLDVHFQDIENETGNQTVNLSPIFGKSGAAGSRTPLSSSNSNLLCISTPKSNNQKRGIYGGAYPSRPTSVKKLLTFSDSQFEQLLGVGKKEDLLASSTVKKTPPCTITRIGTASLTACSTKKCLADSFVRAGNSNRENKINDADTNSAPRPLSSSTTTSSGDCCDISSEQCSLKFKKLNAVTREVLRDRELSRRQLSSKTLQRQFSIWNDSGAVLEDQPSGARKDETSSSAVPISTASTKNTAKKEKTDGESQGFQDILNINNDCEDMEISAICADVDHVATQTKPSPTANYSIPSKTDLNLNDSIVCEAKSPSSPTTKQPPKPILYTSSSAIMPVPFARSSRILLPSTPKKSKPASLEHERLQILYPMIRRTPSKHNPLHRRIANKRKSEQDIANTFKRHCKYYGGNTYLNIIAKLGSYQHILDGIFRCLESSDLATMCDVSRSWRLAVQSNRWAWQQVCNYWIKSRSLKENENGNDNLKTLRATSIDNTIDAGTYKKIPFHSNNLRTNRKRSIELNRSPPVSPSKRKFHENQKIVRTLAPNEKLLKCPRCNKSSRIYNALALNTNHHNNNNNQNRNNTASSTNKLSHIRSLSQTFHTVSTTNFLSETTQQQPITTSRRSSQQSSSLSSAVTTSYSLDAEIFSSNQSKTNTCTRSRFGKSLSYDSTTSKTCDDENAHYAECSGLTCGYRFCMECKCEYHPGTQCKLYEPSSPSKDDGMNELVHGTTKTRNVPNMRRHSLKRLCF